MDDNAKPSPTCVLQINTSGSWRNVLQFDAARRAEIVAGLAGLANTLGNSAKWCLHHPADGTREWLHAEDFALPAWRPVTAAEPAALVDVMVSAYDACDREAVVFMAWHNGNGQWMISGSDVPLSLPIYAYRPVLEPAPAPAALQVAA